MQTATKTYGTKQCANEKCSNSFEARRINMIYCSSECCRESTNARLISKYHESKNKAIEVRKCNKCFSRLSRYNNDAQCHACKRKLENEERVMLLRRLGIEYIDEDL